MNETLEILQACLALSLIWVFWHFGWKKYQLEQLRQKLFSFRDELFVDVASKEIDIALDSELHTEWRRYFNATIRYTHYLTLNRAVIAMILCKLNVWGEKVVDVKTYKTPAEIALEKVEDEKVKKQITDYKTRAHFAVCWYLFATSPAMAVLFVLVVVSAIFYACFKIGTIGVGNLHSAIQQKVAEMYHEPIRVMEVEAETLCSPNLHPA